MIRPAASAVATLACVLGVALAPAPAAAHGVPLITAIQNTPGLDPGVGFARIRAAGASAVRIPLDWTVVAPDGPTRPPGFDADNPNDPHYSWSYYDGLVRLAASDHLTPLVELLNAPPWATAPGTTAPDPTEFGRFAHAAAARYSGAVKGLPRVRYWEVWNEPNASIFLSPQSGAVDRYRAMINSMSAAVHGVRATNIVIAGELFPNFVSRPDIHATAPLAFMRGLFCLSGGRHPHRTCRARVNADVWSTHPYASGRPGDKPANPDDVWIGNLASMRSLVARAQRAGILVSRHRVGLWVTEFGWDSNPPNPRGVPVLLQQRWVAEALYRMWQAGVRLATWFDLRDDPLGTSIFQTGLYFNCAGGLACDQPKPALASFRFPFVAYNSGGRVLVWGRTPGGRRGSVTIQSASGRSWRSVASLGTDGDGIFTAHMRARRGSLRAVMPGRGGASSPSFSLTPPADFVAPPFS